MEVLVPRAAGMDVHKDVIVAYVRVAEADGTLTKRTRSFGTMTGDLYRLGDWLAEYRVSRVGMESTGVYWRAPYYLLEDRFEVQVLNAQHIRNVPGGVPPAFRAADPLKVHSGKEGNSCQEGTGDTRLSSAKKRQAPRWWSTGPAPSPGSPTNSG